MTSLAKKLALEIKTTGPMSIARYMEICLSDPDEGYYTTKNPIGAAGDFTTAPEISQLFGEMIGIWVLQTWQLLGAPAAFALAELGPGRGTLMADILRVTLRDPEFSRAANIILVETSPNMRASQANTLKNRNFAFLDDVKLLPDMPVIVVANEFFDALPVQQFIKTDIGWQERLITWDKQRFAFELSKPDQQPELDQRHQHLPNGLLVERSTKSESIAKIIGEQISRHTGAALIIDYGALSGIGDTFQAVKDHKSCDPLTDQGICDMTCHVQFDALALASGCAHQFTSQGAFLEQMGITTRAQALVEQADQKAAEAVVLAHRRLVHPDEMGALFKVMALKSDKVPELFGFEQ